MTIAQFLGAYLLPAVVVVVCYFGTIRYGLVLNLVFITVHLFGEELNDEESITASRLNYLIQLRLASY